jgi:hypothetical protein
MGKLGHDVDKFGEQHLRYFNAGQHVEWIICRSVHLVNVGSAAAASTGWPLMVVE